MLTDDILTYIDRSVLCWLATVDHDGMPNVSPKEAFAAYDPQTLLIAHIASPKSIRNIKNNPQVCVSFIDVFEQKGYKLKGKAEIVAPQSSEYQNLEKPLLEITQGNFPIRAIIRIHIQLAEPIIAPSYRLSPNQTVQSRMKMQCKPMV